MSTFNKALVDLQRNLRKTLISEELRKEFDSIVSQTFSLQPPSEILRGLTPKRKLSVLKTACINFHELHPALHLFGPWIEPMFKFAEKLIPCEMAMNVPKPTVKSKQVVKTASPSGSAASKVSEVTKTSLRPLPSKSKREKIYASFKNMVLDQPVPKLKGVHISCSKHDCKYCLSVAVNVPFSKCTHDPPCIPGGWYPHVGERLWRNLQKYHNTPGAVFKPKVVQKDGQMDTYVSAMITKNQAPTITASTVSEMSSVMETSSYAETVISNGSVASSLKRSLCGKEIAEIPHKFRGLTPPPRLSDFVQRSNK